jgi:RecB family exonuclease
MRRLFLAPFDCPDATERLLKATLAAGVEPRDILYLCPSPRKIRDTQVRFARLAGRQAFIPPRFQTLYELARDLHSSYGTTRRFRSELKPLLVQRLLGPAERTNRKPAPRAGAGGREAGPSIGYCRAVASFIRDVKRYAVVEDQNGIRKAVADLLDPYEKPKARALEALDALSRCNQALAEKGWSDDEDILTLAAQWVSTAPPPGLLVLDGFVAPNRLEQALIAALVGRTPRTLAFGYGDDQQSDAYRPGAGFVQFLKAQSFVAEKLEPAPARPEPVLLRFNSPEDELTGIARHIKEQCLAGRLDLSATVVCFPELESLAPLAARTFREYGIPATVYPAQDLAASPPVTAVLELLQAVDSGYERVAATAALSSEFFPGLLRLSRDKGPEPRLEAARALNHAARQAGIVKDPESWKHIAERLEPEYGFENDEEEAFARDMERRVCQATGLVEKMMAGAATLGDHARRLKQLLGAVDFCRNLEPGEPETEPLLEDRGELYDILDSLADFEDDFGARAADLSEFTKTLTYLIGLARRTPERLPRGLLVLSMAETLGLAPEHLYFGSLTESNLPSRYPVDPLLPDTVRRKLGMPDIDWHRDHERFHFERTRHCGRNLPWLSYHAAADAKLVLPTPFTDLEPVNAQPSPDLFSPEEEQRYAGTAAGRTLAEQATPVDFSRDQDALAALNRRFGPDRELSVTRLEGYRACPYCFYVTEVMKLEPLEPPALEIEPRQWGIIVHRVLGRLYSRGKVPLSDLKQQALACLDQVMDEFGLTAFWAEVTRRLFENNINDLVECEAALRAEGFSPMKTELPLSGAAARDLFVKGRLDRVDSSAESLRVIDYKTGRSPWVRPADVTDDRTHIQLPLYCHLLRARYPGKAIDNMGIYSTREARVRWLADGDCPVDDLIRAALENTVAIVESIRAGNFRPLPADESGCAECPQHFLCGRPERGRARA